MARKKQSFFGKIMGGDVTEAEAVYEEDVIIEEDPEVEYEEDDEMEYEEELVDDEDLLEDADDDEYEEEYEEVEEESMEDPEVEYEEEEEEDHLQPAPESSAVQSPISEQDEEWMSDYEGALNIDMFQTKDNVIIKSTIAGVRPNDIDITVANDMVTIKGARTREEKISNDDYFYQECYWGGFARSVIIPVDIDSEKIEADLKDGILTVVIPKAAKAKTKKVKVKGL